MFSRRLTSLKPYWLWRQKQDAPKCMSMYSFVYTHGHMYTSLARFPEPYWLWRQKQAIPKCISMYSVVYTHEHMNTCIPHWPAPLETCLWSQEQAGNTMRLDVRLSFVYTREHMFSCILGPLGARRGLILRTRHCFFFLRAIACSLIWGCCVLPSKGWNMIATIVAATVIAG